VNAQDIDGVFNTVPNERVDAMIVSVDALFFARRQQIAQLALTNRLPSIFGNREYAEARGLMSYGDSLHEFLRRAASFVDKIFKGAKPGDLPIEQPTKFNLVINRKTADVLGLAIPPQLYIFADEVIE
jgi:putative ABC transport system substrate-binding protein